MVKDGVIFVQELLKCYIQTKKNFRFSRLPYALFEHDYKVFILDYCTVLLHAQCKICVMLLKFERGKQLKSREEEIEFGIFVPLKLYSDQKTGFLRFFNTPDF